MKNKKNITVVLILSGLCAIMLNLAAGTAQEINQRMKARLPEIVSMKKSGIIGENNKGYLEYIKKDKPNENIVNEENKDRKTIYQMIAKQQKTTESYVGKLRAKQIAQKSEKDFWIQKENGDWVKR